MIATQGLPAGLRQFLRYVVVGVSMNALGYLAYAALTLLGLPPKIAMTITYGGGTALNFLLGRKWVFRHDGNAIRAAIAYGLVYFCGYLLNWLILWVFVDHYGWNHLLVQAVSICIVAVFLFGALKLVVFRQPDGERGSEP